MSNYEWCKLAFSKGWATVDQLKVWVAAGRLTAEEFTDITRETI